jgi:site-specific recombinase XerD
MLKSWIESYGQGTAKTYSGSIKPFFEFLNETMPLDIPWTADRIYEDRKITQKMDDDAQKYKWEDLTVKYSNWLRTRKCRMPPYKGLPFSDNAVTAYCIVVRSLFSFMRVPLILNRPQKRALVKTGNIRNIPYHLTLNDIVAMKKQANTKERYILMVGKSIGLRVNDFLGLKQGQFEANLQDKEAPFSLGVIVTQKRRQPAYPFLDYEAYDAYLNWKQELQASNRWDGKDSYMLTNSRLLRHMTAQEANSILRKLAFKAGIRLGNLRLSFHCLRRFLCDQLSRVADANKWKQIVGKEIPESAYISSDCVREVYAKVMQFTCEEKMVPVGQVADLEQLVAEQGKSLNLQKYELDYMKSTLQQLRMTTEEFMQATVKYLPELVKDMQTRGLTVQPLNAVEPLTNGKPKTDELPLRFGEHQD